MAVIGRVSANADLATLAESLAAIGAHRGRYGIGGVARLGSGLALLVGAWFLLRTWIMRRRLGSRLVPVLLGISGVATAVSGAGAVVLAIVAPGSPAGLAAVAPATTAVADLRWICGKTGARASALPDGDVYSAPWFFWLQAHWDILEGKKTLADDYGGEYPGEKPPEELLALIPLQQQSLQVAYGSEEYAEAYQACHGYLADNLFAIGTVGEVPQVYIAKNNIGNVPLEAGEEVVSTALNGILPSWQLYFKQ